MFPDTGEDLKAVTAGEHQIEKDDIELFRVDAEKSIFARVRHYGLIPLIFKAFLQRFGDFDFIFDYKNTHL